MKFSTIKTDKRGEHLKQWEAGKFFERIRTDANDDIITSLRMETTPERVMHFRRYGEIPRVHAAVELCRQKNGAIGVARYNGLVVLEVRQLMSDDRCEDVKRAAINMPSTLAVFKGATGMEVIILVGVARTDGTTPTTEMEAEGFYVKAYHRVARIYDAVLPDRVTRMTPSLRHSFLMPFDLHPQTKSTCSPIHIDEKELVTDDVSDVDAHLLQLPEKRRVEEEDMTAYRNYERVFSQATHDLARKLNPAQKQDTDWYKDFITGMATELFDMGWPEEETVNHLWRHLKFKDVPGVTEGFVRTLVTAVYEVQLAAGHALPPLAVKEPLMQQVIRRMESCYVLRHNTIMGYTEYRPNHTWVTPWNPVTEEVINTFTIDLHLAGLDVWDRDVKRYVYSTLVRNYNPISEYLTDLNDKWDGRDHIRELAATVPTDNAAQWAEWFHTWFLAMVAQWLGRDRRYGNALVPLLISNQGMHKSAFCRSLLPPELRSWGYTDNLSLLEEKTVHLAMGQMLLINLDEFNRISPVKQQGFLKNILQLATVKVKRPYASHTEEIPRLASFIATTNMPDVLADPTGSRRFLGVQVTGNIDVSQTPNHPQLFAQAIAELRAGTRYWFNDAETEEIMRHNRSFQQQTSAEMFFHQYFDIPATTDEPGEWMLVTKILLYIKQLAGSTFQAPTANSFGRTLRGIPNLQFRRSTKGSEFYVRLIG